MVHCILFQKNDTEWNKDTIATFLEKLDYEPVDVIEDESFYLVKLTNEPVDNYRLLAISDSVSLLFPEDPTLDDFTTPLESKELNSITEEVGNIELE